ncbi:MAG: rRNA maturation RNase YbeY [Acidobacteriota bacterium]
MRIATRNFQVRPIIEVGALRRLVEVTLDATGGSGDEVSFAFVDDAGMSERHGRFVGSLEPTDVLAFPASSDPTGEVDLGDVIICTDQAARQAVQLGHGYLRELAVLALHGLLHLLGYDHSRDRGEMRQLELRLRPLVVSNLQVNPHTRDIPGRRI